MAKLCKKCILPSTYPTITFNKEGVCNYCSNHKSRTYLGKKALIDTINKTLSNSKKRKYDCVVAFSGGRDSTYMLWYIVKHLKLKPLAVFIDSGLIPEQTLINIQITTKHLNVDLVIKEHNYLKKCFQHHLKAWIKRPTPETLITFCVGCRLGLHKYVTEEAIKRKIPIVFSGATPFEGKQYKSNILKTNPNSRSKISFILGYGKQLLYNPLLITNLTCLKTQFLEYFTTYFWEKILMKKHGILKISFFGTYIKWKEDIIDHTIKNELNWKPHPGITSSYRGDCRIGLIRQFLYLKTLGYNDKDDHLSCLIRDSQLSRVDALKRLKNEQFVPEHIMKDLFKKEGIDFENFISKLNTKIRA